MQWNYLGLEVLLLLALAACGSESTETGIAEDDPAKDPSEMGDDDVASDASETTNDDAADNSMTEPGPGGDDAPADQSQPAAELAQPWREKRSPTRVKPNRDLRLYIIRI